MSKEKGNVKEKMFQVDGSKVTIVYYDSKELKTKLKKIPWNRYTTPSHVKSLSILIDEMGFQGVITITKDGYIMDGQHRVEACKDKDIRVPCIVLPFNFDDDKKMVKRIVSLQKRKSWSLENYLLGFVYFKDPSYIYLKRFTEKYDIGIDLAIRLANSQQKSDKKIQEIFMNGKLEISSDQKKDMEEKVLQIQEILNYPVFHGFRKNTFSDLKKILVNVVRTKNYDHDRMLRQMDLLSVKNIAEFPRRMDFYRAFEDIYNHRAGKTQKIFLKTR